MYIYALVKRINHAVNRAEQTDHRADRSDQCQVTQPVIQFHIFFGADLLHRDNGVLITAGKSRQTGRKDVALGVHRNCSCNVCIR